MLKATWKTSLAALLCGCASVPTTLAPRETARPEPVSAELAPEIAREADAEPARPRLGPPLGNGAGPRRADVPDDLTPPDPGPRLARRH